LAPKNNVTMKSVAAAAGVSSMTVSRVLNNESSVSEETKQAVLLAVKNLGYQRNMQASSLAAGKKYQIAFFYDNPRCSYMVDVFVGMLTGIQDKGYHIIIEQFSLENIKKVIETNNVDGVLLPPPFCEFKEVHDLLNRFSVPFVRMAAGFEFSNTHSVRTNDKEMAKEMVNYLVSLGHTKIGYIKGHNNQGCSFLRTQGVKEAMEEAGLTFDEKYCEQGHFTFESGYIATVKLFKRCPDITAVFSSSDIMAQGVLKHMYEANLRVPDDVSVAGFDDTTVALRMYPQLTTVHQPSERMALAAIDMLVDVMRQKDNATKQYFTKHFESKVVVRDSTAPVKNR